LAKAFEDISLSIHGLKPVAIQNHKLILQKDKLVRFPG